MAGKMLFNLRARDWAASTSEGISRPAHELRLMQTFEDSGCGWFWATNSDGKITYLSQSAAQLFGKDAAGLLGSTFIGLFRPGESNSPRERLPFVLNRQLDFERLVFTSSHETAPRSWEMSGRVNRTPTGAFDGYFGFCIDITERLQSSASASQLALFDALTGLPNRLNMAQYLEAHSGAGRPCAVILLDLDRFKAVNDSLGHPAGDALLTQVANRLLRIVGDRNKVFRLGGDEFTIILPGNGDTDMLGQLAEQIIDSTSQPYSINGVRCVIGASLGIATAPRDGAGGDDLYRKADLALYAAKSGGRGIYRFFSNDLLQVAEDRRALEEDLRDALARGDLQLFYQPQVNAMNDHVTGVEALIRWHHPQRGTISPAIFVAIAEEANLIDALGEWTIRKACEDAAAWPDKIRVAVNVSPIQFANTALPAIVTSALAHSGLEPNRLELELTEGVFLSESVETDTMFAQLKAVGVRLALDDFGTGYSSLGYLRTAPFDKIKIDQSFVRGATLPGSRNGAIIAAIVALAGALDMETTAEGIETIDQLDLMRDLGVSHIQGYLYSKAIASDVLCASLSSGRWTISPEGPARQRSERRSMYRKAGAILGGYYHAVIVRNLSESGALIDGLIEVPYGTHIIVDFGDGRLQFAVVRRASNRGYGVEFGETLIDDGTGNLVPRHVVPPYQLAKFSLSGAAQAGVSKSIEQAATMTTEALATLLGLAISTGSADSIEQRAAAHQKVKALFSANPMQNMSLLNLGSHAKRRLTEAEWERLKVAVEESHNPQLKYIIALVVFTSVRFQEILTAKWSDIDLVQGLWRISASQSAEPREIRLSQAALQTLTALPRVENCEHLIVNPRTKRPYKAIYGSWDAARRKADLESLSIHDLRKSIKAEW